MYIHFFYHLKKVFFNYYVFECFIIGVHLVKGFFSFYGIMIFLLDLLILAMILIDFKADLHSLNKSHLAMVYYFLNVVLNSVCYYFV